MVVKKGDEGNNSLLGTEERDQLFGLGGDDVFIGLGDADFMAGGEGTDTVTYLNSPGSVGVDLLTGDVSGGEGIDSLSRIENVFGSAFNDRLDGDSFDNSLNGLNGDDVLVGGDGADILNGELDDDTLVGGVDGDVDCFLFGSGDDTLFGFEDGVDLIGFPDGSAFDFEDIAIGTAGDDALIVFPDDPGGATLRVDGMAGQLDESDFLV
jgi:Ca2+-binding RTX toxin-like protein